MMRVGLLWIVGAALIATTVYGVLLVGILL
jgi:hypothetical protein